ncbi:MAG: lipopolysaccharide heptosyltransferase II, partial [Vicinamibacterales bacterium]
MPSSSPLPVPARVLVLAPNWLGDAVMALPALADIRRHFQAARLVVAARRAVAELFELVPGVDEILTLNWNGALLKRAARHADVSLLRDADADLAILMPNSFSSAWLVRQAGIPERWGYSSDLRSRLLTRVARRPRRLARGTKGSIPAARTAVGGTEHQGEYYQRLVRELGIANGPLEPVLLVSVDTIEAARRMLVERGWSGAAPLVTLAPGAAYGTAKQWIPSHVTRLVSDLVGSRGASCVLVGSRGDAETTALIRGALPAAGVSVVDLAGMTTLKVLAGVLSLSRVCVSNDSGAMHLAAAVGTPVVAIFGPTIEQATRPLTRAGISADVLTHEVWCRPCMLRECPI